MSSCQHLLSCEAALKEKDDEIAWLNEQIKALEALRKLDQQEIDKLSFLCETDAIQLQDQVNQLETQVRHYTKDLRDLRDRNYVLFSQVEDLVNGKEANEEDFTKLQEAHDVLVKQCSRLHKKNKAYKLVIKDMQDE